ncbi:GGDEF domain-containing protein [Rhizobium sp. KVB221]|uniref:diguanylate cyclase n=1 Tax=Rhizobium setariae TaxID=2801340 RepID=A0A936YN76_9HYPH|nr:GGDEF domain-containing protein [Rhizobium setariae]MBL0372588.1 GGDEF domain-containing protein [Rhizobium setariae]
MGAVAVEDVDRQIHNGFRLLRFAPDIEAPFLRDYVAARVRLAPIWAVIGILIYDLVYFGDATMMSDVFSELVVVRFLIFTPFVIASVLAVRRWPNALLYDLLSIAIALLGVTLPMSVAVNSHSPYMFVYQNGNVAAFLFFVIALRPRFAAIVIGLVLMCASHFTTTSLTGAFDAVTHSGIVTFYVTVSIFLAMSAYFMEQKDRMNFLNQLRGSMLHAQLEQKSERDELTGLLNRHSLARVREAVWRGQGSAASVAVIMLDIDRFKLFNDVHGHIEGDDCIRAVSRCICREVGGAGETFRFGGEEILVLMANAEVEAAYVMAERIRSAIESLGIPHHGLADGHVVTASLGVACGKSSEQSLEDLLKGADAALYNSKRNGRNAVSVSGGGTGVSLQRSQADDGDDASLAMAG